MKFYGGVRGGQRNKWLDSGSDPDHDAALEVALSQVLCLIADLFHEDFSQVSQTELHFLKIQMSRVHYVPYQVTIVHLFTSPPLGW